MTSTFECSKKWGDYPSTAPRTDTELSQAAKQGDGRAQYELAKRLASQPDYPNAMHRMQQAADQQIRASAAWQVGDWS